MRLSNVVKTFILMVLFTSLWQWLELSIYGSVESRVVDDIIFLFMIPFFYCTVSYVSDKINKKKRDKSHTMTADEVFGNSSKFKPLDGENNERD